MPAPRIVLTTLNARYIHASLGLRYLLANMGALRSMTVLREFTIRRPAQEVGDELLATLEGAEPGIIGFGVYIWNVAETTAVIRRLRAARPDLKIILGGPEVSHETAAQEITGLADHVITGWGDLSFARLCRELLAGPAPLNRIIPGEQPLLSRIAFPYGEYSDEDLAHRLLYVEASRGCPFKCEFCLSALDKTAWAFELEAFLAEMDGLYRRGARHFKFVDRTFNLKLEASARILEFFLSRLGPAGGGDALFLHFELVPDHLPTRLKALIARFPPGVLQFEVGIQSFDPAVQALVSRRQDEQRTEQNLRWLVTESYAHVHADLIFGLPGETLESFAAGFDRLYALRPHEIQLGILKRLRGTPIVRHTDTFELDFDPAPPYAVRRTSTLEAASVQSFSRLARYWEVLANAGRFKQTLALLLEAGVPSPFRAFQDFSAWLWERAGRTNQFSPEYLVDALFDYLCTIRSLPADTVRTALLADYLGSGARGNPTALQGMLPKREVEKSSKVSLGKRQAQHRGESG